MALLGVKSADLLDFSSLNGDFKQILKEEKTQDIIETVEARTQQVYQKKKPQDKPVQNEDRAKALQGLASLHIEGKKYDLAINCAMEGLRLDLKDPSIIKLLITSLFQSYTHSGKYRDCILKIKELLVIYDLNVEIKLNLLKGLVYSYMAIKDVDSALLHARQALELPCKDSNVRAGFHLRISAVHLKKKEFSLAYDAAVEGIKENPTELDMQINLHKYLLSASIHNENPEELYQNVEPLVKNPQEFKAFVLSKISADPSRAESRSKKKMVDKNPQDPSFYPTLCSKFAYIFALEKKVDLAMDVIKIGLDEIGDGDSKALLYEKLAFLHTLQGCFDEAKSDLEKAIELCLKPSLKKHLESSLAKYSSTSVEFTDQNPDI